ncbi:MAG TPA: methyltransferase domain-containing protein [Labilithrix sp.]|jgi:trans-aconitate methyltransferase|nr:methyltransferase domain-containing protein [Labilithrix sp.]
MSSAHEWDAAAYQRLSDPQFAWGLRVLDRVPPLCGDETVLDAGVGSGRLTEVLARKLPHGHVIAVDRSANMLDEARRRLADLGDRVTFVQADLATFVASTPVHGVFSTATFHWILDHDRLFASVYASLRPNGWLVAQCGGLGNLDRFHARAERVCHEAPFHDWFRDFEPVWNFQAPEVTSERLRKAGFVDIQCHLETAPTPFADEVTFRQFVQTVVLRAHLARLPDDFTRERFLDAVVARAVADGELALDYVRLNIAARR